MNYSFNVEQYEPEARQYAPSREEILATSDKNELREMQFVAEEHEILLKTQLEFLIDEDPRVRGRRIACLIYWRQALSHIKRRQSEVHRKFSELENLKKTSTPK